MSDYQSTKKGPSMQVRASSQPQHSTVSGSLQQQPLSPSNPAQHSASQPVLEARDISKTYRQAGKDGIITDALSHITFSVARGEFVGIMGPSGSGKSTLLNCISTIDEPSSGQVLIDGTDIVGMNARQLSTFRRDKLGFVFQDSNLLDTLTCYENIALTLTIKHTPAHDIDTRIHAFAQRLNVAQVLDKYPYQISGGQKQRIAAVRATIGNPQLILADEPTGALDSKSAAQLLQTFESMNNMGSTILMVTHDPVSASYCQRIVFLKDGVVEQELTRSSDDRSAFYAQIVKSSAEIEGGIA